MQYKVVIFLKVLFNKCHIVYCEGIMILKN